MRGTIRKKSTTLQHFYLLKEKIQGSIFFLTISRHLHRSEDIWIKSTLDLSKKLETPYLLSQDVFFHSPKQKIISDLLAAIRTNNQLEEAQQYFFPNGERSLQRLEELEQRYSIIPDYELALKDP